MLNTAKVISNKNGQPVWVVTQHSQEYSLAYWPRLFIFESNTFYDWLNRMV